MTKQYKTIGIMSGTSLDGLDIVFCCFTYKNKWNFSINKSATIEYSQYWEERLNSAPTLSGLELNILHKEFGRFIGESVNSFIKNSDSNIDLIASHGHTVFHQPDKKLTLQIGDGNEIAAITGIKTVCDFRSLDVALGGQGAPLVPIGDKLLFSEYENCLNLGGFANISFEENNKRIAFDICPANIVLNYIVNKLGQSFDKNGALGLLGKTDEQLLNQLNNIEYYQQQYPKSLGKEWLNNNMLPIIEQSKISIHNRLRTLYEHIAYQISLILNKTENSTCLITGGGTYNKLLINLIKQKTGTKIIIPEKEIIEFKEALLFAFLGVLKIENQENCLASVTGATRDSSTGIIIQP